MNRKAEPAMNTPDTATDEALEDLLDAICNTHVYDDWEAMREAAAPHLAAIRRHAAADALNEQARRITKVASFYEQQARSGAAKGQQLSSDTYALRASQAHGDAGMLRNAARDKIAEGYAFECAAFSQECETRVPDAGDFCNRHEPEDDEDRWAE